MALLLYTCILFDKKIKRIQRLYYLYMNLKQEQQTKNEKKIKEK